MTITWGRKTTKKCHYYGEKSVLTGMHSTSAEIGSAFKQSSVEFTVLEPGLRELQVLTHVKKCAQINR